MPFKYNPYEGEFDWVLGPGSGTATVEVTVDDSTAPGTNPVVPDGSGNMTVAGAVVAAHSIPIETHSRAANEFNIEVQVASGVTGAPGNKNAAGLSQFNDTHFTVDSDGYVSLIGGGAGIDSFSTDVAGPVAPDGFGNVDVTGSSIFSDGSVANTLTLNVQATANTILYGSGANTNISELGPLTDGQLVIGSTGLAPVAASLTQPAAGITITGGAGSVTFALDDDLAAVEGLTGSGVVTRTGASTWSTSTIADRAVVVGDTGNTVQGIGPLSDGQLVIGDTGGVPVAATLTEGSNITITNGAGSITIAAAGGGEIPITSLDNTDSPYTVLTADKYLSCDVSLGVLTISLPNAPTTGRVIRIKDLAGNAGTNNISVTTVGGVVTIDGATTYTMNTDYQSISVIFNGTSYEVF